MPPSTNSKYLFSGIVSDNDIPRARLFLGTRGTFPYRDRLDNEIYVVQPGDTLGSIAHKKYGSIAGSKAATLYWIIAEYQPLPLVDATIALRPGQRLILPSPDLVRTEILV